MFRDMKSTFGQTGSATTFGKSVLLYPYMGIFFTHCSLINN
jgi:hypothetical protein